MTIATGNLRRHVDVSKVSGTGDVAEFAEFSDGAVAVRWPGKHPSTATWGDIRDVEAIHGHGGSTVVKYTDNARLLTGYRMAMPFLLNGGKQPIDVSPHPDHPDRLRVVFENNDVKTWRLWIALFSGSTYSASQEEVDGEMRRTWAHPDGNLWLVVHTPIPPDRPTPAAPPDYDNSPGFSHEQPAPSRYEHDPIHDPRD